MHCFLDVASFFQHFVHNGCQHWFIIGLLHDPPFAIDFSIGSKEPVVQLEHGQFSNKLLNLNQRSHPILLG
jgi:hypothetical protein